MARLLGIDASKSTVRVATIRTSYRRIALESFAEADIAWAGSEVAAIRMACGLDAIPAGLPGDAVLSSRSRPTGARPDACAIALSGERSFYRRLELPAAAQKEIENVLGFELESNVPFEMDEAVFDHRPIRGGKDPTKLPVFAALGRTEDVRARITAVREAIGIEPERVASGPLPLANLDSVMTFATLEPNAPVAILDVGEHTSEVVVMTGGGPVFARTLSRGTAGLPASAHTLARDLRQTIGAWRSQGGTPLDCIYLSGIGASAAGASEFLSVELGVRILPLPSPRLDAVTPDQAEKVPRFAKALGLALGLTGRSKGLNLRRGALEGERSYPYLREKIPVLAGLAAVIMVSFGFSTIAEVRALDAEHEVLAARLGAASHDVLGEETTDPDRATELLKSGPGKADEDPLPRVDAFDVMVQLSKAVPKDLVHDVLELDVQRGKVVIQGVVPAVADSDVVLKGMKEYRCFKDPQVKKNTQFGENRNKYLLEFELKCEDKKKPKDGGDADAAASASAGPDSSAKPDSSSKPDVKPDKSDAGAKPDATAKPGNQLEGGK